MSVLFVLLDKRVFGMAGVFCILFSIESRAHLALKICSPFLLTLICCLLKSVWFIFPCWLSRKIYHYRTNFTLPRGVERHTYRAGDCGNHWVCSLDFWFTFGIGLYLLHQANALPGALMHGLESPPGSHGSSGHGSKSKSYPQ